MYKTFQYLTVHVYLLATGHARDISIPDSFKELIPSTADTQYRILNVPTVFPFTSMLKQPLNSRHLATPYNGHFAFPIARKQYSTTLIYRTIVDFLSKIVHHRNNIILVLLLIVLASVKPSLPVYS